MQAMEQVAVLVENARKAQAIVEGYSQEQVDALCRAMAKAIFDNAEELADMAVKETRMGVYENKVAKNKGKARVIWNELKGKKSVGVLRVLEDEGLIEVAKPIGVVGAITPTTNPIVTPMCNAMFAVKGRNAIVICPHPRAKACSTKAVEYMNEAIAALGAPKDLIQIIEEPSVDLSGAVMKSCDVCISTGGMGMVKAAYASGKPAFGVGAGNVQCIIDDDADISEAVPKIIDGRVFDNGIICSGEQTAIISAPRYDETIAKFSENGAYYIDTPADVSKLRDTLFINGVMNKDCVGMSAVTVAKMAGLDVHEDTRVLLVKADGYGKDDLFSKEKMCPVISTYAYTNWDEAIAIANANLEVEGKGHSVAIHSNNKEHIERAAMRLPVSRFLINQICATMNGGSFFNSLSATTTLGCGSWGNNSISENLSWKHLFNVSRIAYVRPGSIAPTDEEIWGE